MDVLFCQLLSHSIIHENILYFVKPDEGHFQLYDSVNTDNCRLWPEFEPILLYLPNHYVIS